MHDINREINCVTCNKKAELFKLMTDKELMMIDKTRHVVSYKAGEIIFKQGTKTTQVFSLTKGIAKAYVEGINKDLVVAFIGPTTFLGGPGSFVDDKHHQSVSAIEDVCLCFYDLEVFKKIAKKNSKVSLAIIEFISRRVIDYYQRLISFSQKNVESRVAETIIYLNKFIYKSEYMNITIPKNDLADYSGMTRDTFVRVMKDLHQDEIIDVNEDTIKIVNFEKLNKISTGI